MVPRTNEFRKLKLTTLIVFSAGFLLGMILPRLGQRFSEVGVSCIEQVSTSAGDSRVLDAKVDSMVDAKVDAKVNAKVDAMTKAMTDAITDTITNVVTTHSSISTDEKNITDGNTYASIMENNFGASVSMPDYQFKQHLKTVHDRETHVPTRKEILENLYHITDDGTNFYDGFVFPTDKAARMPVSKYVSNFVQDHTQIFILIESLMPSNEGSINFIVEAGSFVGSSANKWAILARKHNATVLCIDTWEGDVNMWVLPQFKSFMSIKYGRGHLYENFIQNIIDGGVTDVILPMATSSIVGAKVLWAQKFMVDVAYVDTAHEQGETLGEMFVYWELLRPGGVLLGDDYFYFPAVKRDVDAFVEYLGLELHFTPSKKTFVIKKPL